MANKIQIKRGLKANLPLLDVGEPAFTTDTKEFFIGDGISNINFAKQSDLEITNSQVLDLSFKLAGGTANAITLSMQPLTDGYSKTFIASANNAGAATKINGKPLYKPNTTIAPNLISGKAYTVWYNQAGDCFFIKASAEGDAIAANVLAGKKFSNDNDTGLVGTMPNNSQVIITPGISNKFINKGYHDGTGYVQGDSELVSANIRAGINIFGVDGKPSVVDTADATAGAADIVLNKTAYVNGNKVTGQATIASLGGAHYITGPISPSQTPVQLIHPNGGTSNYYLITVSTGFMPMGLLLLDDRGTYITHYVNSINYFNDPYWSSGGNRGNIIELSRNPQVYVNSTQCVIPSLNYHKTFYYHIWGN
ncbi:hyaluronate lyase N-terminal domain-containing protein [Clostridium saccharoperbutylacetonicum]